MNSKALVLLASAAVACALAACSPASQQPQGSSDSSSDSAQNTQVVVNDKAAQDSNDKTAQSPADEARGESNPAEASRPFGNYVLSDYERISVQGSDGSLKPISGYDFNSAVADFSSLSVLGERGDEPDTSYAFEISLASGERVTLCLADDAVAVDEAWFSLASDEDTHGAIADLKNIASNMQ